MEAVILDLEMADIISTMPGSCDARQSHVLAVVMRVLSHLAAAFFSLTA